MKQMEVTILGQSYLLGCPEGGEAALLEAVASVDREMSAIRQGGKVKARERIAVLAALNLAYALAGQNAAGPASAPDASAAGDSPPAAADADANAQPNLDALIQRIDRALRSDGQLL